MRAAVAGAARARAAAACAGRRCRRRSPGRRRPAPTARPRPRSAGGSTARAMSARNDAPRCSQVREHRLRHRRALREHRRFVGERREQIGADRRAGRTPAARRASAPGGGARPAPRRRLGFVRQRRSRGVPTRPRRRDRAARGRRGRIGDARRQDVALPRRPRQLEALQLRDHLPHAVAAVQLRAGCDVLPDEEEAHEVGRRDRLDLARAGGRGSADGCARAGRARTTRARRRRRR